MRFEDGVSVWLITFTLLEEFQRIHETDQRNWHTTHRAQGVYVRAACRGKVSTKGKAVRVSSS
jgi:hypothetical protein